MRQRPVTAKLNDVCLKIQDGAHRSPQKLYPEGGPGRFLYITSKNIRNGYMDLANIAYVDAEFHSSIYPRCNPELGDILLTKDGANTGNVTLNTIIEPFSLLSSVCLIKTDPSKLIPRFLLYYIQSDAGFEQLTGSMTGAAIKRIILQTIKASVVPLPPLPEQQRIVAILDEAFSGLATATANTEKNLKNARELFESYLHSVFDQTKPLGFSVGASDTKGSASWKGTAEFSNASSRTGGRAATTRHIEGKRSLCVGMPESHARTGWTWRALDGLARMESGHTPSRRHPEYWGGDIPWIGIRDAKAAHGREVFETLESTNALGLENSSARLLPVQTVCLSRTASVGYVTVTGRPMAPSQDFVNWVCSEELFPRFLMYLFLAQGDEIFKFSSGAVHQTIYFPEAKAFQICLPSMNEQHQTVEALDALREQAEKLEGVYRRKIGDLAEIKQSILQKAFSGGLSSIVTSVSAPSVETKTASFAASVLILAYERHRLAGRESTFGHKKAQKLLHLVDAAANVDLGRDPIKDAAGPNDFDHMLRATDWAEQRQIFKFNKSDNRYIFQRLQDFKRGLEEAKRQTERYSKEIGKVIEFLLPMNSDEAEIAATVYAAWNNLIVKSTLVDDEAIVREAREDWHPEKLDIPRHKFFDAIGLLRNKEMMPTGKAKLVREKYLI